MGCVKSSSVIKINNDDLEKKKNQNNNDTNNYINLKENINNNIINENERKRKDEKIENNNQNDSVKHFIKKSSEIDSQYFILELFSKNSFSSTYKIQSKSNQNIIKAMKIYQKPLIKENEEEIIIKEINFLKSLNHENIIKIEEIYSDNLNLYVMFENIKYGTLENILKVEKKYSENQVKIIILQILFGIKYLNLNNFIHSDLKPENIVIVDNFIFNEEEFLKIKLLTLGSENILDQISDKNIPYYMAPELFQRNYNMKNDIWSIGIILFQLIYGYKPFNGDTLEEFINNIENKKIYYEKESEKNFNLLSIDGRNLLKNMLIKDLNKRIDIDSCIKHNWFRSGNLSIIEEESKNEDDSLTFIYKKFNSILTIKTQFNQSKNNFHTGLYKVETNLNVVPKKIKTICENPYEDIYHLFNYSLTKFINYHYIVKYKKNKEEINLLKLYNENKDLIEKDVKNLYKCILQYCGILTFSVKYISFKEKIKNDINSNFTNNSYINFGIFENLLIQEKKLYLEIDLLNFYENLEKKNKEEIEKCLNIDFQNKDIYQNYYQCIKNEIKEDKIYSFDEIKVLINHIIEKLNVSSINYSHSNTYTNSNVYSNNFSNNATFNETLQDKSHRDNDKNEKEIILKSIPKLSLNKKLNTFSIFNQNNNKQNERNFINKQFDKNENDTIIQKNKKVECKTINSDAFDPEQFLSLIEKNYK